MTIEFVPLLPVQRDLLHDVEDALRHRHAASPPG